MGFAFFNTPTDGWIFGPPAPAEPPIPQEFYERTGYVPFDKNIPGEDVRAIDTQAVARNADFERWLARIRQALAAVGLSLEYNLYNGTGTWYTTQSMAEVKLGSLQVFLSMNHYDAWTPGQAAEQLRRDSKKVT